MALRVLNLAYHFVRKDGEERLPGLICEYDRFCRQMEYLATGGWTVLTCGEFVRRHKDHTLPEKTATLSFDDGLRDGYTNVFPALQEHGFPGTFFVITETLEGKIPAVIQFQILIKEAGAERMEKELLPAALEGTLYPLLLTDRFDIGDLYGNEPKEVRRIKVVFNRFVPHSLREEKASEMFAAVFGEGGEQEWCQKMFLSASDLSKMLGAGMEIGSHSRTHPFLPQVALRDVEEEMVSARNNLTGLGHVPETFGWPFGGTFPEKVVKAARRYYASAWNYGLNHTMPALPYDLYDIPRVDQQYFEEALGAPPLG